MNTFYFVIYDNIFFKKKAYLFLVFLKKEIVTLHHKLTKHFSTINSTSLFIMKKFILFFALLIASMTFSVSPVQAASAAVTTTIAQKTTVDPKAAAKKNKKSLRGGDNMAAIIFAILIPPVGVYLKEGAITTHFWIDLLLTFLFYLPGMIYALYIVLT